MVKAPVYYSGGRLIIDQMFQCLGLLLSLADISVG